MSLFSIFGDRNRSNTLQRYRILKWKKKTKEKMQKFLHA